MADQGQAPAPQYNGYVQPNWNNMAAPQPMMTPPSNFSGQTAIESLTNVHTILVNQDMSIIEAVSQGCCEMSNKYFVYNGQTGDALFGAYEQSEACARCCCSPYHTTNLFFAAPGASHEQHTQDLIMRREGCFDKPGLCCFACSQSCSQVATVLPQQDNPRYIIEEKTVKFSPEFVIYDTKNNQKKAVALITGPACFGGCSELCFDSKFQVGQINEKTLDLLDASRPGDICTITKRKPDDFASALAEMCTDTDRYAIQFYQSPYAFDAEFKAAMISALLLLDYSFFEFDNGMITCTGDGKGIRITFFNCYCIGCLCPCCIECKKDD